MLTETCVLLQLQQYMYIMLDSFYCSCIRGAKNLIHFNHAILVLIFILYCCVKNLILNINFNSKFGAPIPSSEEHYNDKWNARGAL